MKKQSQITRSSRGFTLVELIIVIAVIGLLAAVLIPVFSNVVKKANSKSALSDARNSVENYLTYALEDPALPRNLVIVVEKAGKYYVYGYNTEIGGSIMISTGNPFTADDMQYLVDNFSWNGLQGTPYDPNVDQATLDSYDIEHYGAFYLVPYVNGESQNAAVRGFTREAPAYRCVSSEIAEIGANMAIYHGCIVGSNFSYNTDAENGGSENHVDTPPAQASYSVSFTTTGIDSADLANVVYKKGSQVLSNPATLTEGTGVGTLTAECPVATSAYSYTFTGATASNGHSTIDEADMTITFAFTKVMAQTYNVTYNANGGTGTMTDNTDYLTNAVITLPENTFTAPEHKHFTGWKINNTGELRAAGYQFNITADTEIYAQWADDTAYTVSFDANGGTGSMASIPSVYAGAYELPECAFTKTHYHFNGWLANNAGDPIFPHSNYDLSADVTFYATWEQDETYTITYNGNGATGSAPTDSNSYYMNDSATLAANTFTYTHKHFTGWKVANGGALLAAGSSYTVTGSVTMYAQWEDDATYTVTYDKNTTDTVSGMPANDTGIYAGSHTLSSATPTRTGYNFLGWGTSAGAASTVTSITVSGNTTVYAVWQIKSYTVTFTDGSSSQNKSYNYNTTITLADENPLTAPSGKEFDKFTVGGADATALTVTANTTVTVVWKDEAVSSDVYYFGGAYRKADQTLDFNATKLPTTSGSRPVNILPASLTLDTTTLNGTVVHRTFTATSATSVVDGVTYIKCTETTDWSVYTDFSFVDYSAGATVAGSKTFSTRFDIQKSTTTQYAEAQFVQVSDITSVGSYVGMFASNNYGNKKFAGSYDGMGYTINNITLTHPHLTGLFANIASPSAGFTAGVQNLNVTNVSASVPSNGRAGAAVIGDTTTSTGPIKFKGINVSGALTTATAQYSAPAGGILGKIYIGAADIENCTATVNITRTNARQANGSYDTAGGIVGYIVANGDTVHITDCWYKGTINTTSDSVGGIVGAMMNTCLLMDNCHSYGSLKSSYAVGGLIGRIHEGYIDTEPNVYTNCSSTATRTGSYSNEVVGYNG